MAPWFPSVCITSMRSIFSFSPMAYNLFLLEHLICNIIIQNVSNGFLSWVGITWHFNAQCPFFHHHKCFQCAAKTNTKETIIQIYKQIKRSNKPMHYWALMNRCKTRTLLSSISNSASVSHLESSSKTLLLCVQWSICICFAWVPLNCSDVCTYLKAS